MKKLLFRHPYTCLKTNFLIPILLFAFFLRIYGLNWDQGAHLHPDERFLTMVAASLRWPHSLSQYLNPQTSPLNPANAGYPFFVYGTFPLFLTKALAQVLGLDNYTYLNLLGRALSAIFDTWTVVLVYLITKDLLRAAGRWRAPKHYFGVWGPQKAARPSSARRRAMPYLAAFFYASSVLPIQLSHFFAVDIFLTFFLTLTFYLLLKALKPNNQTLNSKQYQNSHAQNSKILLGIALGLALASKISALLFIPIIILAFLVKSLTLNSTTKFAKLKLCALNFAFWILPAYLTFRLANPYAFASANLLDPRPNPLFIQNLKTLQSFNRPDSNFPPAIQWIKTKPIIFPLRNLIFYGLGLPLGILSFAAFFYSLFYILRHLKILINIILTKKDSLTQSAIALQINHSFYRLFILSLIILWIGGLFLYQSTQFVKAMRYFAPIYPFLVILAAFFLSFLISKLKTFKLAVALPFAFCALTFLWPLTFLSIYSQPHSRLQASHWIYENIPARSTLACEHWDDCLPLPLPNHQRPNTRYQLLTLPLYDSDTPQKWQKIKKILNESDYIIISSNRLYGSIPSIPNRYPQTSQFYQELFSQQSLKPADNLRFVKIAQFTSRPRLPLSFINFCLVPPFEWYGKIAAQSPQEENCRGLTIIDDYADESFTVYDHPKVIIFQKTAF